MGMAVLLFVAGRRVYRCAPVWAERPSRIAQLRAHFTRRSYGLDGAHAWRGLRGPQLLSRASGQARASSRGAASHGGRPMWLRGPERVSIRVCVCVCVWQARGAHGVAHGACGACGGGGAAQQVWAERAAAWAWGTWGGGATAGCYEAGPQAQKPWDCGPGGRGLGTGAEAAGKLPGG
jgi:hypothetical protein